MSFVVMMECTYSYLTSMGHYPAATAATLEEAYAKTIDYAARLSEKREQLDGHGICFEPFFSKAEIEAFLEDGHDSSGNWLDKIRPEWKDLREGEAVSVLQAGHFLFHIYKLEA